MPFDERDLSVVALRAEMAIRRWLIRELAQECRLLAGVDAATHLTQLSERLKRVVQPHRIEMLGSVQILIAPEGRPALAATIDRIYDTVLAEVSQELSKTE